MIFIKIRPGVVVLAHDGAHHGDGVDLGEVGHVITGFGLDTQGGAIILIFIQIGPVVVELAHDSAHQGDGVEFLGS